MRQDIVLLGCAPLAPGARHGGKVASVRGNLNDRREIDGAAAEGPVHGLHTPDYDFNDAALPHGIGFWVELVMGELGS